MWLGLVKLCSFQEAQQVLNAARNQIPESVLIWVTALKLEEKHIMKMLDEATRGLGREMAMEARKKGEDELEKTLNIRMPLALKTLKTYRVQLDREKWLQHAAEAERGNYLKACQAIVRHTMLLGGLDKMRETDPKQLKHIWIRDAENHENNREGVPCIHTARAIYNAAVRCLPHKKGLWRRFAELEIRRGTKETVDEVLARATKWCPGAEVLWLMRAKQKWLNGRMDEARRILDGAFAYSPDSEGIHLAAVKLESESQNIQRARMLLKNARKNCNTAKIWQQSVQLERQEGNLEQATHLCSEGLEIHPKSSKLWMIGGQIIAQDVANQNDGKLAIDERDAGLHLSGSAPHSSGGFDGKSDGKSKSKVSLTLSDATRFFEKGLQKCPNSVALWVCAIDCEIAQRKHGKARSLLEKARLRNPKAELLWHRGVIVEELENNAKMALHTLHRGLQECGSAGFCGRKRSKLSPRILVRRRAWMPSNTSKLILS